MKMLTSGLFEAHESAAFLAWHRYFIHIYERKLKEQCGYTGVLTYWDWGLDWEDITTSPVWDGETGFGGDGNPRKGESIAQGHCIENGPFTELEVPYFDMIYHPHCLSRGFQSGQGLKNLSSKLSPEALDNILESRDYDTFNLGLEHGAHLAVPRSLFKKDAVADVKEDITSPDYSKASPGYRREVTDKELASPDYSKASPVIGGR
ncbi:MAG: hypothetical protein ALECFALPRED_010534 [Alectoria fallacina]|uniref:Tyrosinase copper-binding domain-containing protein n=1 Tax=Alectoria fallacina TaxID=1903189 RepID=A0A8H3IJQ0_9LECA|nr:MAG: hypothetical protein ALECFALPRED_010534 [Alectoria fallacina]